MKNAELQELTASEPLSLVEEYNMQLSWWQDDDKCTFIVLDAKTYGGESDQDEIDAMIGDVNLFFNNTENKHEAEIEIMIAEKSRRGCGRGKEALLMMMQYGIATLGVTCFVAKIKSANDISRRLFEKIGFVQISESAVFQEVTYNLEVGDEFREKLSSSLTVYEERKK